MNSWWQLGHISTVFGLGWYFFGILGMGAKIGQLAVTVKGNYS
jgi:hypothetical protein